MMLLGSFWLRTVGIIGLMRLVVRLLGVLIRVISVLWLLVQLSVLVIS